MAYTILNTDGTTLLLLADGQKNESATSLTLVGKNYSAYGQDLNNNFVKLLANFASTSGIPPRSPLKGQLWYDTTNKRLKVYDNGFKVVSGVIISTSEPINLQSGDLWFDSTKEQLNLYNAGVSYTVGPNYSVELGQTGLVVPSTPIRDNEENARQVLVLKSYGNVMGLVYYDTNGESFEMNSEDATTYLPDLTPPKVVSGTTLLGDLNVTGKISNNYFSLSIDLDVVAPAESDAKDFTELGDGTAQIKQNPEIEILLNKMFPPNPSVRDNTTTEMPGVIIGSQARVLCKYSTIAGVPETGYQVRVFKVVGLYPSAFWTSDYFRSTDISIGGVDRINVPVNYFD